MRVNAPLDTSRNPQPHSFQSAGVVADSLTGIHSASLLATQGVSGVPTGKNPEDSNLASVEVKH
jgi:hypothetical protein